MAFVRNPVVYVPDLTNGRPVVDGKVYIFAAGTIPPVNAAAINPATLLTITFVNEAGNTVEQPQPLYTSKGGCLYGNYPQAAAQYIASNNSYVFAAYNKNGKLQYSANTFGSDEVESADLAAVDSAVPIAGVAASTLAANSHGKVSLDFYNVPVAPADCSASLTAAINAADTAGLTLVWPNKSYTHATPISVTLTNGLNWECSGAQLTYTGGDTTIGVTVSIPAAKISKLYGTGLSYNAGGHCHIGMNFIQPASDAVGEIELDNIAVENTEMQVGVGVQSAGFQVRGGFRKVTINKPFAKNIKMRATAGVPGSRGITGMLVVNNFPIDGAYALNTYINEPTVSRVYSLDAAYQYDMDGIGVFANPEGSVTNGLSYCKIDKPNIKGCWGRDVKLQVGYGEIISPESVVNEGPTGGIINTTYDFQTGSGQLIGGSYEIGAITHTGATCRFSGGATVSPVASAWRGGVVRIATGANFQQAAIHDVDTNLTSSCRFESVTVIGRVRNFLLQRTNGYDKDVSYIENVTVKEITESLARVESRGGGSAPYRGVVYAKGCSNQVAMVPIVSKGITPNTCQALFSEEQCFGFTKSISVSDFLNDGSSGLAVVADAYYKNVGAGVILGGTQKSYTVVLQDSTEFTMPDHGYSLGYTASIFMCRLRSDRAQVAVDDGGIEVISKGSTVEVSDTEPVTGALRIWRSGKLIKLKQVTGQDRPIMITFIG